MDDHIVFRNKLIFVMGMQRSGTTALLYALGQDPNLQVENEQPDGPIWKDYLLRPEPTIRRLLWSYKRRLILKPVLEIERRSIDDVIREFKAYEPLVVWIYRNPVNVWSSARIEFDLEADRMREWIEKWNLGNQSALKSLQGPHQHHIAVVRYEDLIERREVFTDLCQFLGIEPRNNLFWREDLKKGRKYLAEDVQRWIESQTGATLEALHAQRIKPRPVSSVLSMSDVVGTVRGTWSLNLYENCQARLLRGGHPPGVARVEIDRGNRDRPFEIQLVWDNLLLEACRRYTVALWARADRRRPVTVQVTQNHEPWEPLGYCQDYWLDESWQPISFDFIPPRDEIDARIYFDIGQDEAAVEVSTLTLGSPLFRLHHLDSHDQSKAVVIPAEDDPDAVRVWFESLDSRRPESIQLIAGRFEIEKGKWYSVSARARSERPRSIAIVVGEDRDPWTVAGIYQELALKREWDTYFHTFRSTADGAARVYFDLGNDEAPVEIADVAIASAEGHLNDFFERNGAECQIEFPPNRPGVLRVTVSPGANGSPDDVQIFIARRAIEKGHRYYATFQGRADKPRNVGFGVVQGETAWTDVGLYYTVGVGTTWKPYYYEFVAEENAECARVLFDLGDSSVPMEIKDVVFRESVTDLSAQDVSRLEWIVAGLTKKSHPGRIFGNFSRSSTSSD